MKKARDLLSDGGAVWVSTPNFDSGCGGGSMEIIAVKQADG